MIAATRKAPLLSISRGPAELIAARRASVLNQIGYSAPEHAPIARFPVQGPNSFLLRGCSRVFRLVIRNTRPAMEISLPNCLFIVQNLYVRIQIVVIAGL